MSKATNKAKQQARVKPKKRRNVRRGRRNPALGMRRAETPLEKNATMYAAVRMAQVCLDVLFGPLPVNLPGVFVRPECVEMDCLPGAD